MFEVRISPDRTSVAIRSEYNEGAWNAWAVMNNRNGGHWATSNEVAEWTVLEVPPVEEEE